MCVAEALYLLQRKHHHQNRSILVLVLAVKCFVSARYCGLHMAFLGIPRKIQEYW
jgi:hypothetical protein